MVGLSSTITRTDPGSPGGGGEGVVRGSEGGGGRGEG